ncbi:MAG TPA: glycosyltransferase family 4 protein [Gemmatimonadaceae bacterium]|nr:glycosyltransferase family 4 protein [Gemmatimonadaceae bacterium]
MSARAARELMGITQSAFDPASRVRFIQYIPLLEEAGWRVSHRPNRPDRQWYSRLPNRVARGVHYRAGRAMMHVNRVRDVMDAGSYDAVFLNRDLMASELRYEQALLARNPRVVFDFDDAIFVGGRKGERHARWMCEHAAWVTPGNAYLAEWSRQWTDRVTIIPTVIDTDRYERKEWSDADFARPMRVGWTGSDNSIGVTLFPHLEMLARSQKELGFELVIISNTEPTLPVSGMKWRFHPWRAEEEGALGRMFDVGIMPLVDDAFQRGKCGFKLLQCMAAGLPTIGSPVGVNSEIVQEGCTGFLATTDDEWHEALRVLTETPELRASMGMAGWERCENDYSVHRWFPELLATLDRVACGNGG